MKPLLTLLMVLFASVSFAQDSELMWQFYIVKDKDGYVNVRSGAGLNHRITGKLNNGHIVSIQGTEGNWASVVYTVNNKEEHGYIYTDRLKPVNSYKSISITTTTDNSVTLGNGTVTATLTRQPFVKSKHRFTYYDNDNTGPIKLVDGKPYWGCDGTMPSFEYRSILINTGKQKITLPQSALEGLYQPSLENTIMFFDEVDAIFYMMSQNSDGAGTYAVIWKIEKGVYKERYITVVG